MNKQHHLETSDQSNSIFDFPPSEPIAILRQWINRAKEEVHEPWALALATTDAAGRTSNRIVHMLEVRNDDLIFATHTQSQKGRDIASTGWASGVLYWRETKQQIILTGPAAKLSGKESDILWQARPSSAYPMSIASRQSDTLEDESALRKHAQQLAASSTPLLRPETWHGYALRPVIVEFWQAADDRLHRRLLYEATETGWSNRRLQP